MKTAAAAFLVLAVAFSDRVIADETKPAVEEHSVVARKPVAQDLPVAAPKPVREDDIWPIDLARIDRKKLERVIERWPVRHEFDKKAKVHRWYDEQGRVAAFLRTESSKGSVWEEALQFQFVQGASDYRYVPTTRYHGKMREAGWVLQKDGTWRLLSSSWTQSDSVPNGEPTK